LATRHTYATTDRNQARNIRFRSHWRLISNVWHAFTSRSRRNSARGHRGCQFCSSSGGSLRSSAALLHASLIARLICITTASMLRRTTMSREHWADILLRCVSTVPNAVDQFIDIIHPHQFLNKRGLAVPPEGFALHSTLPDRLRRTVPGHRIDLDATVLGSPRRTTARDDVRFRGKIGSHGQTVKMTRMTQAV
jgi:hypothetical protein